VRVQRDGTWSVFAAGMICPNYGLFDASGNYYVTDSGNWMKRNGRLLRFDPVGRREVVLEGYGYTNGLALAGNTLFMAESDTDRVFAIDLRTGQARVYAEEVGRLPDGLALDGSGDLFASCYASDQIHRISAPDRKTLYAWDRWAIKLSRPTNLVIRDGWLYVANLGRTTITLARIAP
jgi:gluconolactonase